MTSGMTGCLRMAVPSPMSRVLVHFQPPSAGADPLPVCRLEVYTQVLGELHECNYYILRSRW